MKTLKYILFTLIFLAASWSLFSFDFFRVHDYTHAARISEMTRALVDGHFPVRWTENFGYGYGMPLFEFYAPLPYYIGSLAFFLSGNVVLSIKLLFIISTLGTLIGSFKLGKELFSEETELLSDLAGILTAAAITLAPYRAVNLYVRGALSEAWAIMALPWILYGLLLVLKKKNNSWATLTISLVVLFLSHNLTTMLFLPLSVLFFALVGIVMLVRKDSLYSVNLSKTKSVLTAIGSYFLAIAMSAFYLFPTFIEKDFTKVEQYVLDAYFNFRLHFLYIRQFLYPNWGFGGSAWGVDDDISFFLGAGQLLALIVIAFFMVRESYEIFFKKKRKSLGKFILIIGLGFILLIALYMSLLKSQPIWEILTLLKFVQFPWRWLSIIIVFLGILVGASVTFIRTKKYQLIYGIVLTLVIIFGNTYYFRPEVFLDNSDDYYYIEEEKIAEAMSDILQDYIPVQMPKKLIPPSSLINTNDPYEVITNKTHQKLIRTNFENKQTVVFNIADFPGWYIEVDGERVDSITSEDGLLQFEAPSGSHLVSAVFGYTQVRKVSDIVSFLALIAFIGLLIDVKKPEIDVKQSEKINTKK